MSLAPPVNRDGFSFGGDLFAEASGHNRHRRATVAELKDHFKSGSEKDHSAHWFEAQLIHYGLPPPKTKAVARMRLFDAVNGGKLSVPAHISKLESELKKEWQKNERAAKKLLKDSTPSSSAAATTGTKRKATSSVDVTVNVGGVNISISTSNSSSTQSTTKRAKTAPKAAKPTAVKDSPKPKTTKAATPKAATPKAATPKAPAPKASASSPIRPKQYARRTATFEAPRPNIPSSSYSSSTPGPRSIQTARRGGSTARGRITSSSAPLPQVIDLGDSEGDDPPPPYTEYEDDSNPRSSSPVSSLRPLGLLNGSYEMQCPYVLGQWSSYDEEDFELVLTLSGRELWGRFSLGVVRGVLRFAERPFQSSHEPLDFTWRGEEDNGSIVYGNNNRGWVRFLGDGRLEGQLDYMRIDFTADRFPGQGTRSGVEAADMRAEWNGYTERRYEEERRNRW
ncbi:hypothetical protein F4778DRAFT_721371 [Xylariomycetidae sp. FL2044]|nr:hypothetical protein F4778DRAFT_721371 [Xylariomycetidae sp. FL2044]